MITRHPLGRCGVVGVYKLKPTDCKIDKLYRLNHEKFCIIKGKEYISDDLALHFPDHFVKQDGGYKTMFGPCIYHNSVVYARTNHNMSKALGRQLSVRNPEDKGYEEMMVDNQIMYEDELLDKLLMILHENVNEIAYKNNLEFSIQDYVDQPHKMRSMRQRILEYLRIDGLYGEAVNLVTMVKAMVKAGEFGKYGKVPRLYVSLGPTSIYTAGHVIQYIKSAMEVCYSEMGHNFQFIGTPTSELLQQSFGKLLYTEGICYMYHSDDSCISYNRDGKRWFYNIDISSCDSSHSVRVFNILLSVVKNTPFEAYIRGAIQQCQQPMQINSYSGVKGHTITVRPYSPVLYSGSTLTTIVNNLAQYLLFSTFVNCITANDYDLAKAAQHVGYKVTVEGNGTFEQLQFLKHSPIYYNGDVYPITNIGVMLRSFGSCWGDLPIGRGLSLDTAILQWNTLSVRSFVHYGNYYSLNRLRHAYIHNHVSKQIEKYASTIERKIGCSTAFELDDILICQRYGITCDELYEIFQFLIDGVVGSVLDTRATRIIMHLDYGYPLYDGDICDPTS